MHQALKLLSRHWKPLIILNLLILVAAIVGMVNVKKVWPARAELILPNATTELDASLGTLGNIKSGEGLVFTQQIDTREILSKILLSSATLSRALEADPEKGFYSDLDDFRDLFSVEPSVTSTTISLVAEAATPDLAEQRLENLIASFQQQLTNLRQDDVNNRSRLIQQELGKAEEILHLAESRLLNFQKVTKLADVDAQTTELVRAISELNSARAQLRSGLLGSQAKVVSLSKKLGQSPSQALEALRLQANSVYQANRRRLAAIDTELSEARIQFADEHPLIISLMEERAKILNDKTQSGLPLKQAKNLGLDNTVNSNPISNLSETLVSAQVEASSLKSQAEELQRQTAQFNAELSRVSEARVKLRELQREYDIAEGTYNALVAQLNTTSSKSFTAYPNVQVLDAPKVDVQPSGAGRRLVVLGALLTSLLGSAALITFREKQKPSQKSSLLPDGLKRPDIPILDSSSNIQDHAS